MTYEEKVLKSFDEQIIVTDKKTGKEFKMFNTLETVFIKSFISSALKKQREEIVGCIDDNFKGHFLNEAFSEGYERRKNVFLTNLKKKNYEIR